MKKKVFLDLDDTVFDTSLNLRNNLKGYLESGVIESIWDKRFFMERPTISGAFRDAYDIYHECMYDWNKIPVKQGALEGVSELIGMCDLCICSEYYSDFERLSKLEVVGKLWGPEGYSSVYVNGRYLRKYCIDMSGTILVDDNKTILVNSNADVKICFYNKETTEDYKGIICYDWDSLVDTVRRVCLD